MNVISGIGPVGDDDSLIFRIASSACSPLRDIRRTRDCESVRALATSNPIPPVPPVMTAVFRWRFKGLV